MADENNNMIKENVKENAKPFDINEFLKRHLTVKNWLNYREQQYTKFELTSVLDLVMDIFQAENTLATISPPCTVVGDIHGQYADLVRLLNSRGTKVATPKKAPTVGFSGNRWVFLGDYVDRGNHSIECICLMFSLKIIYPSQYVLLRGNHETRAINFAYGFREELINKLGDTEGPEVWDKFNAVFAWMPLACYIGGRILCMHGGLSPDLISLDHIRNIKRPLVDVATVRLAQDLLWADPMEINVLTACKDEIIYAQNHIRGLSVAFNDSAIRDTCQRLKLHLIVRAHQMMPEGFKFTADKKLLTIFSAPRYMNETDNFGAVLKIDENGKLSIVTFKNKKPLNPPKNVELDEITRGDDVGSSSSGSQKKKSSSSSGSSSSNSKTKSLNNKGNDE